MARKKGAFASSLVTTLSRAVPNDWFDAARRIMLQQPPLWQYAAPAVGIVDRNRAGLGLRMRELPLSGY